MQSHWKEGIEAARRADILDVALRRGFRLRRQGPDWCGPCLTGHAKRDGFVVTAARFIELFRLSRTSQVQVMAAPAAGRLLGLRAVACRASACERAPSPPSASRRQRTRPAPPYVAITHRFPSRLGRRCWVAGRRWRICRVAGRDRSTCRFAGRHRSISRFGKIDRDGRTVLLDDR